MWAEGAGLIAPLLMTVAIGLIVFGSSERLSLWLERVSVQYMQGVRSARDRFFLRVDERTLAMGLVGGAFALGLVWFVVQRSPLEAFAVTGLALVVPAIAVRAMWRRRMNEIRAQIEPALALMANRWRTFPDVAMSFRAIEDHMDPPIADEFKFVLREMKMGRTMDEALRLLEIRVPIRPISLFCIGVRQSLPLGGNVAAVLDQIAAAVREANRLELFIESKTATGRFQAYALAAMPLVVGYFMYKIDPTLIEPLFHTKIGNMVLAAVIFLDVVGLLIALKIVNIKT